MSHGTVGSLRPTTPAAATCPPGGGYRRTSHVFFYLADWEFLDLDALMEGTLSLVPLHQVLAVSLLTEKEVVVDAEELRALAAVPSDRWISADDAVREHGTSAGLLGSLAERGLLVTDSDDPRLAALRERDVILTSVPWNRYSLLAHVRTKWRDVHTASPLAHTDGPPTDQAVLDRFGTPPPHFHHVESPLARHELPVVPRTGGLFDVLARRKTTRSFAADVPMTEEQLSVLLYWVWGCHGYKEFHRGIVGLKKTSPSGGGLHPVEAYPIVRNVEGVGPGLYHYNVEHHRLDLIERLEADGARTLTEELTTGQSWFAGAHVAVIMGARFARNYWKYRNHARAYSVVTMDAAHLSQTFYLVATELGLGAFVTGAINGGNAEDRLGLDGAREGVLAMCGAGVMADDRQGLEPRYRPYVPRTTRIAEQAHG
ncbi:MAG: putative peptide maturation dehydrogenase [Acidimicrobiia bacterium]